MPKTERGLKFDGKTWTELKQSFIMYVQLTATPKHLIVAVLLPTDAIEIIRNTEQLETKIKYYIDMYDEQFRLNANPNVRGEP